MKNKNRMEAQMPIRPTRALLLAAAAAVLAACSSAPTTEQEPAAVEDRKPAADTQPVGKPGVASVDLTASAGKRPAMSVLTDPNSPLSKRSIFYGLDKYDVADEFRGLVEAHARFLRDNPGMKMLIQGNTDERGSREYNLALGQKRSEGVKRVLMLLGVKEEQVESVSLGEEKPRAQGSTEEAWAQNRRSDMLYSGEF